MDKDVFDEERDEINPDSWTARELLKHVYREIMNLKDQFQNFEDADRKNRDDDTKKYDTLSDRVKINATAISDIQSTLGTVDKLTDRSIDKRRNVIAVVALVMSFVAIMVAYFKLNP